MPRPALSAPQHGNTRVPAFALLLRPDRRCQIGSGANHKHDNMPQDSGARLNAKRKATLKIAKRAAAAEAAGKGRAEGTTGRKKADKKKS